MVVSIGVNLYTFGVALGPHNVRLGPPMMLSAPAMFLSAADIACGAGAVLISYFPLPSDTFVALLDNRELNGTVPETD